MESFLYNNPVKVVFGNGKRKKTGNILKGKYSKVLFVCSKGPFRENGLYHEIKSNMEDCGITVYTMNDIDSNPRVSSAREGADICKKEGVECIVALGGGSTLDCTKVMAAAAKSGVDPWNFLWGDRVPVTGAIDTVMIPTIASTGTELNYWSVIMDDATKTKSAVCSDHMYAKYTIMDPEITASIPMKLTIWAAMDILSHTFEYYFNGNTQCIFQSRFSESIIHTVIECVDILILNPKDVRARGELMWASVMAWGGLAKIGRDDPDMACHTMELVSFKLDGHHGGGLGVITPLWMRYVYRDAPHVFARFAQNIFGVSVEEGKETEAALKGIEIYEEWLDKIGAPKKYIEVLGREVKEDDIVDYAKTITKDGPIGTLRKLDESDVINILKQGM